MAGKQAKILSDTDLASVLSALTTTRHPIRNRALILLSVKGGLRVGEIARLRWPMLLDANGEVGSVIEVRNEIAKGKRGRIIPLHPLLRETLRLLKDQGGSEGPVIRSERGSHLTPVSACNLFKAIYRSVSLENCSSHSGRRTFITKAARTIGRVGGSLEDVRRLAGHSDLGTTSRYIEANTEVHQRLVSLL
jgi:integrase